MKILVNPEFLNMYEELKKTLRQFELTELENFLKQIEKKPDVGATDTESNITQRILENNYFFCTIIFEYIKKRKLLIFISIELLKK